MAMVIAAIAGLAAAGATAYSAQQGAAANSRNARVQRDANLQNYMLNRQQVDSQDAAARESRQDQLDYMRGSRQDAATDRQIMMQATGDSRRDALQQRALLQGLAAEDRAMARTGSRDSRGNVVEYVDGIGWVERPSADTQRMIRASDQEELSRLTTDANRSRMDRGRNYTRRIDEGALARAQLARLNPTADTTNDIEARTILSNVLRGRVGSEGAEQAVNSALVRRGASGVVAGRDAGGLASTLAAIAAARADAPAAGREAAQSGNNATLNSYNLLASRASAPEGVAFNPTGVADDVSQNRRTREGLAPQGLGAGNSAMGAGSAMLERALDNRGLSSIRSAAPGANPMSYNRQQLAAPDLRMPADTRATVMGGYASILNSALSGPLMKRLQGMNWGGGASTQAASPYSSFNSNDAAFSTERSLFNDGIY